MPRVEASETTRKKQGNRLYALRQKLKMTVREIAMEFMVARSSISQWESGSHSIPGPVLKLMEIYEEKLEKKK